MKIVPDLYVAWHAGISSWKKDIFLNSNSIGIEISNPGHEYGYKILIKNRLNQLLNLSKKLKKKYKIKKENILGHSDIAPLRKKDPGEKFPWKLLKKKKYALWHNLNEKKCKKLRKKKMIDKNIFINYYLNLVINHTKIIKKKLKFIKNFQRRFRPQLISSIVDQESYEILKSLI